jgi:NO-binding membrane sensor protein with MHYT domain
MAALAIPRLLYEEWVWMAICLPLLAAILAIRHFRREPLPKPHPFFVKHRKTIRRVSDIVVICSVSAMVAFVVWSSFWDLVASPAEDEFIRQSDWQSAWLIFTGGMMGVSAWGGLMVGLLSVFQTSITTCKRIVLLILCLLPVAFTVVTLSRISSGLDWQEVLGWRAVPLIILVALPCWLVNGPPVLTGQPFSRIMWRLMRKLNLAPADYSEWW